jgi:hypothetical protein
MHASHEFVTRDFITQRGELRDLVRQADVVLAAGLPVRRLARPAQSEGMPRLAGGGARPGPGDRSGCGVAGSAVEPERPGPDRADLEQP